MSQKCFTAIKCRILSNSREKKFSTYFRLQLDVTYHDLVLLYLKPLNKIFSIDIDSDKS